ncbi:MAG: hypothetical protein JWM56_497 [Candidatus Peribacteria bacterium]|nr:hypothetical protein [Candidatus Peribacteria bacterium]
MALETERLMRTQAYVAQFLKRGARTEPGESSQHRLVSQNFEDALAEAQNLPAAHADFLQIWLVWVTPLPGAREDCHRIQRIGDRTDVRQATSAQA